MPAMMLHGLRKGIALCLAIGFAGTSLAGASTLTVDPRADQRVYQRQSGGGEGVATIPSSGTYTGSPGAIEIRVVTATGGTEVVPWTVVDPAPAGGLWTGTVGAVPAGGWYLIEARDSANPAGAVQGSERFGVGVVIATLGQSNMARMFTEDAADGSIEGIPESPHAFTSRLGYGEPPGYEYERPWEAGLPVTWGPVTGSGGIRLANHLTSSLGLPVALLDLALDWTGIDDHWNEASGSFVGWQNFVAAVTETGGVEAVLWHQGAYDAVNRPLLTTTEYRASLEVLYDRIQAVAGSGVRLGIAELNRGDYSQTTQYDASFDAVRRAQREWAAERAEIFYAGSTEDLGISTRTGTGNGHFWAVGYRLLGDRYARAVLDVLSNPLVSSGAAGPSWSVAGVDGRVVRLEATHVGGDTLGALFPERDLEGFELTDGTWGTDVLGVERAVLDGDEAGNNVLLVLDRDPTGPVRLRYLKGQNPNIDAPGVQGRRDAGNWLYDDVAGSTLRPGLPVTATGDDLGVPTLEGGGFAPVAREDILWIPAGDTAVVHVLSNDLDPDGMLLPDSVVVTAAPTRGTVTAIDSATGALTYRHDGGGDDELTYSVVDDTGRQATAQLMVRVLPGTLPALGARSLHFESDRGLSWHESGVLGLWRDLSGSANHLIPTGDPRRVPSGLDGADYVQLDGSGDKLSREADLFGLPGGNSDRTVFTVLRYNDTGFGGFAWGNTIAGGTCATHGNRAFGMIVNPSGDLMVQGWCTDLPTDVQGTGQGWLVHSAVLGGDLLNQYKNGVLIGSASHVFNTDPQALLVLGAELDSAPFLAMDVAAILVYPKALNDSERQSVESYLQSKYLAGANAPPQAVDDRFAVAVGGAISLDVLANDTSGAGLDPASVVVETAPAYGIATVDPATGQVLYTHSGSLESYDSFTYTVADGAGRRSDPATVTLELFDSGDGLPLVGRVLHLESDAGVEIGFGEVRSWADQSPQGNDLTAFGNPMLVSGDGPLHVALDGGNDKLERGSPAGLPAGASSRSLLAVVRYRSAGYGGVAWGSTNCNQVFGAIVDAAGRLGVQGWCGGNDFATAEVGTGAGWLLHSVVLDGSELSQYRDGTLLGTAHHTFDTGAGGMLRLGVELDGRPYVAMDIAAVVVYDRALGEAERQRAETFLTEKYLGAPPPPVNEAPVAMNDSAEVPSAGTVDIAVLDNDTDDGTLDPTSVTLTQGPSAGSVVLDPGSGVLSYTHDGSGVLTDSFQYTVADTEGAVSNTATVIVTAVEEGLPGNGLVLWLESDAGILAPSGGVESWMDQSGNGNDLSSTRAPAFANVTPSGQPAVVFDGVDDSLQRTSSLVGLPSGAQDRTLLTVVRYHGTGFGGVTWGSTSCNRVFGAAVDNRGALTVQGWCLGNDYISGLPGTGEGWMVQGVVLESNALSHFRDGRVIDQVTHAFDTDGAGRLVLGAELDGRPPIAMDVAAVLIYDRALSTTERQRAEDYLVEKYLTPPGQTPPVVLNDHATVGTGALIDLDVLANDSSTTGLDRSTVTVVEAPTAGTVLSIDSVTGEVRYQHDGSGVFRDSFRYTVTDVQGQVSAPARVELTALPVVDGLAFHLDAGSGVSADGNGQVGLWLDLSTNMNDLLAFGDPQLVTGPAGEPVVRFDGSGDRLESVQSLAGLPAGNGDRTVFLVVDYHSRGFGGLTWGATDGTRNGANCAELGNRAFGAVVDNRGRQAVQGWCQGNDVSTSERIFGAGWLVQSAVLSGGELLQYKDGALIDQDSHTFATEVTDGWLVVGAELDGSPQVDMDLGLALVYDRALTERERLAVEQYLAGRFFPTP